MSRQERSSEPPWGQSVPPFRKYNAVLALVAVPAVAEFVIISLQSCQAGGLLFPFGIQLREPALNLHQFAVGLQPVCGGAEALQRGGSKQQESQRRWENGRLHHIAILEIVHT